MVLPCCSPVNDIDASGVDSLRDPQRNLAAKGIALRLSAVKKQAHDVLERTAVCRQPGESALSPTNQAAIAVLTPQQGAS